MQRAPLWVGLYLGLWGALAIPFFFAGLVFLVPGFYFVEGAVLLAIAVIDIAYLWFLTQPSRRAWALGVAAHLLLIPLSGYYVQRGPPGLAWPALVLNVYSALVLLGYRRVWQSQAATPT